MTFINSSAYHLTTGQVFATKKALREACSIVPTSVLLTTTAAFGPVRQITADQIVAGERWQVVGPSPLDRKWYATVSKVGDKVVVK